MTWDLRLLRLVTYVVLLGFRVTSISKVAVKWPFIPKHGVQGPCLWALWSPSLMFTLQVQGNTRYTWLGVEHKFLQQVQASLPAGPMDQYLASCLHHLQLGVGGNWTPMDGPRRRGTAIQHKKMYQFVNQNPG